MAVKRSTGDRRGLLAAAICECQQYFYNARSANFFNGRKSLRSWTSAGGKVAGSLRAFVDNKPTLIKSGASMKKWISKVAIAAAVAAVSSSAMAVDGQFFVNGEAAGSDVNIANLQNRSDTSAAGAVRLGYLWNSGVVSWGVETGYVDLGKVTGYDNYAVYDAGGPYDPIRLDVKTRGELLGGNFKLHYGDYGWFLSTRGGWFHSQTDAHARDQLGYASVSNSSDGNGFYAGIGLGYDFNPHIGVSLNYDFFQTRASGIYDGHFNTSMYGGTFEYRF
jgi:OmpA-OmpF porin, OOP family